MKIEDNTINLYDGEIRLENSQFVRRWIDEDGQLREARFKACGVYEPSPCLSNRTDEPRAYHREYYRKVRRYRDGREPRVQDEP